MNPKTIRIDDTEYVPVSEITPKIEGDFVIVRCRNAGVHAGTLGTIDDKKIRLHDSRRLWRWRSAFTLSELAIDGPVGVSDQKYARVLPELDLTPSDVCEIIKCTPAAKKAIMAIPPFKGN